MRGLRTGLAGALVTVVLGIAPAGAAAQGLTPGGVTPFDEQLPVNVVFVGFDEADAPWDQVRAQLPDSSEPIVRSRIFYGVTERLGLGHQYEYRPHYTSQAWEDDFFAYLASIAEPAPLTEFQTLYNQQGSALDVTSNHAIDAPAVERRLIDTAPAEVDTTLPTIFFINWHGRPDFRFHVYSKTGERDPDTGHDFGAADTRKLVAWGGTTPDDEETGLGAERGVNRVWFYDLSAGPESWGGSYDITNPDLDLDGAPDYRIPPSWEYGHYRPAGRARRRPRPGDALRRAEPPVHELAAVPALLHSRPPARAGSTWTSTRSRAGRGSTRRASTSSRTCSSPRSASSPPGT